MIFYTEGDFLKKIYVYEESGASFSFSFFTGKSKTNKRRRVVFDLPYPKIERKDVNGLNKKEKRFVLKQFFDEWYYEEIR